MQKLEEQNTLIEIHPNPFSNSVTVKGVAANTIIAVYDVSGKLVASKKSAGAATQQLLLGGLRAGVYFIQISGHDKTQVIKIVKAD